MNDDPIRLADPDISPQELAMVEAVLSSPRLGQGRMVEAFECKFAAWAGRRHAVAVPGAALALWLCLSAWEFSDEDEIVTSGHAWHQIARAISFTQAKTVFADIDYWSGTLSPLHAASKIGDKTRAILAGNTNGHPADWEGLAALARERKLLLIEDCTESIDSRYKGKPAGSFGDAAIFDFSQTSTLCIGEGAMILTDDPDFASTLKALRNRQPEDRHSVSITRFPALDARMSEIAAALGIVQLQRVDEILAKRREIARWYEQEIKSFEGIKPPYIAPDVSDVNWFLYTVHLGTRFTLESSRSIVDDLHTAGIEAQLYSRPLYLERNYLDRGWRKGTCLVTEKVADRAIALPFHSHLSQEEIAFIVKTAKDASVNVGAGAAIYL